MSRMYDLSKATRTDVHVARTRITFEDEQGGRRFVVLPGEVSMQDALRWKKAGERLRSLHNEFHGIWASAR